MERSSAARRTAEDWGQGWSVGRCARRRWGAVAASLVLVGSLVGSTFLVRPAGATAHAPTADYTWPKYGYNASDTGTSPDPTVSTANAGHLGVKWMVPDQTQSESSPVVGYDAQLGENVVYQGNIEGGFTAFDAATGAVVWSTNLGSAVISTPIVADGAVWVDRSFSPSSTSSTPPPVPYSASRPRWPPSPT